VRSYALPCVPTISPTTDGGLGNLSMRNSIALLPLLLALAVGDMQYAATYGDLHDALRSGDPQSLAEAIAAGADLDQRDALGYSPLHRASEDGDEDGVRQLLAAGAGEGKSMSSAGVALAYGTAVDSLDNNRATALMHASGNGHVAILTALIDAGASIRAADEFGLTPLHYAAESGEIAAIEALLSAGANVEARDEVGKTPMQVARAWGFREAARVLGATDDEGLGEPGAAPDGGEEEDDGAASEEPAPKGGKALNPEKLEL